MPASHVGEFWGTAALLFLALLLGLACLGACGSAAGPEPLPVATAISMTAATAVPRATSLETQPVGSSLPVEEPVVAITPAVLSLSGAWRFAVDPEAQGESRGWATANLDDSGWTTVTVPHTWGVMEEYADYDGLAWYRRTFALPPEAGDACLRLRFEAVFYQARVWLNGTYLGEHEAGYTPFEFDVSGIAQPGTGNVVAVRVDNLRAVDRIPATLSKSWSFDWWNYGGLVRDVSLRITSRAFIAQQQVVAVPHLLAADKADRATVDTTVTLRNISDETLVGRLVADIVDDESDLSVLHARPESPLTLAPGEITTVTLTAEVPEPRLWHFDHPQLYRWSTALLAADGERLHEDVVTFGVRLVELKEAHFYLNGEPVRLVGLTRHADSPGHGLAETVTIMTADYDDLKTLNMVFSRPVHYPQHEFILDYCDRHGILLIPEVPAWQLKEPQMQSPQMRELERQQLREMITAAFNHPSIWAWSVGNEYDSKTPAGLAFTRDMIEYVRSLDPTRPVGFASRELGSQPAGDATAVADFVMMNQYFGTWAAPKTGLSRALDDIHAAWPDKVVVISEYGFESHWNVPWGPPSSSLDPAQYYVIPEDTPGDLEEADHQRQLVIAEQMEVFRSKPFVAAAIFWTYQDYRTPSGFIMGVVDAARNRRPSWSVLREEYAPLRIESVTFGMASDGGQRATVALRVRGPVEEDLPAYTLRGYYLDWAVKPASGGDAVAEGALPLPTLEPGAGWTGDATWTAPEREVVLTLRVVRPTGFAVLEQTYDLQGQWVPDG
jgi:beta-galactosidase/beta-glucuronidase